MCGETLACIFHTCALVRIMKVQRHCDSYCNDTGRCRATNSDRTVATCFSHLLRVTMQHLHRRRRPSTPPRREEEIWMIQIIDSQTFTKNKINSGLVPSAIKFVYLLVSELKSRRSLRLLVFGTLQKTSRISSLRLSTDCFIWPRSR